MQEQTNAVAVSSAETLSCAVLFLDIRNSTLDATNPTGSPSRIGNQIRALLDHSLTILESAGAPEPNFMKSAGDGFMFVWHLEGAHDPDIDIKGRVLTFAIELNSQLSQSLADQGQANVKIGVGLACGDLCRVSQPRFTDYFGFTANLAAKLQDAARPHGLVVQGDYFLEDGPGNVLKNPPLDERDIEEWAPLHKYGIKRCYATEEVILTFDWTCLSWPGLAITDRTRNLTPQSRRAPDGLNTKGITVITHEGIQGKLDTLKMWPCHSSREDGVPFQLIIDDFDSLAMLHKMQSVRLTSRVTEHLTPVHNKVSRGIYGEEENERFAFAPIRCGVNALAANRKKFSDVKTIRKYDELFRMIESGRISPANIAIYDNLGASLPLLFMMTGINRHQVYSMGTDQINKSVYKLEMITKTHKILRYDRISDLAAAIQTGARAHVVVGGGAWLGTSTSGNELSEENLPVEFHIPDNDGGLLWVEGAAMMCEDHAQAKSLLRFLAKTVLDYYYQIGLAYAKPYGSSPVSAAAIKEILKLPQEELHARPLDAETTRIFTSPHEVNSQLTHRRCPDNYFKWNEAWNRIKVSCTQAH